MDLRPGRALAEASGLFEAPKEPIAVTHLGIAGPKAHDDIDDGHTRQTGSAQEGGRPVQEVWVVRGHAVDDVLLVVHDEHGRMITVDGSKVCHTSSPSLHRVLVTCSRSLPLCRRADVAMREPRGETRWDL